MSDSGSDVLSVDTTGDGTIVVQGDIDMAGGPVLEVAMLEREDDRPVVLDLRAVSFIDSSGLRTLLGASRRAATRGTRVVLRAVGPEVARLLEITGTTDQFEIESRRD